MKHSTLIQLVEDDQNLGSLIEENLREEGYGVNWLKNGGEALSKFDIEKPKLLILDVMLPDIDGFELATRFRAKDKQIPILFLTAKDLTEDRIKGFESGGDDYITKPFSMKELLLRMEVFLRRSGIQEKEKSDVIGGSWALDSDRGSQWFGKVQHLLIVFLTLSFGAAWALESDRGTQSKHTELEQKIKFIKPLLRQQRETIQTVKPMWLNG